MFKKIGLILCLLSLILQFFVVRAQESTRITVTIPARFSTFGSSKVVYSPNSDVKIRATTNQTVDKIAISAKIHGGDAEIDVYSIDTTGGVTVAETDWVTPATIGLYYIYARAYNQNDEMLSEDWSFVTISEIELESGQDLIGGESSNDGEFNQYTSGMPLGWSSANTGAYSTITPYTDPASDEKAIEISCIDNTVDKKPYISLTNNFAIGDYPKLVLEIRLKQILGPDLDKTRSVITTGNVNSGKYFLFFMRSKSFHLAYLNESGSEVTEAFGNYASNEWHTVTLVMDLQESLMDAYLDGVKKVNGEQMRVDPKEIANLYIAHFTTNTTGSTIVDYVKMYGAHHSKPYVSKLELSDSNGNIFGAKPAVSAGVEQIDLYFADPVDEETVDVDIWSEDGESVQGVGQLSGDGLKYTIGELDLEPGTVYTVFCNDTLANPDGETLSYPLMWMFSTAESFYEVDAPRFFVVDDTAEREIISVNDVNQTGVQRLKVETQIAKTSSDKSNVVVAALVRKNGVLEGWDAKFLPQMSNALPAQPVSLQLEGELDQALIRLFVCDFDSLKTLYSYDLPDLGNAEDLIFDTTFEETVINHINNANSRSDLVGTEWSAGFNSTAAMKDVRISYESGGVANRYAAIIDDYTEGAVAGNKVLQFWQQSVGPNASKARVQMSINNNPGMQNVYIKTKVFLSEDFNELLNFSKDIGWLSLAEFWDQDGWTDKLFPYRVTLNLCKRQDVGNGEHFYFSLTGEKAASNNFEIVWRASTPEYEVPVGEWMTWEMYFQEGDRNNGKFIFTVTAEDGERHVVFNLNEWMCAPGNVTPTGLQTFHPLKLYTSTEITDYLGSRDKALEILWDDLSMYSKKSG